MNSSKPIGVFDSGLGGLTVVRAIKQILPNESIVYFGDTGRVPYGTRSAETIKKYAVQDENFLVSNDVKIIIAACGTVSSVAYDTGENLDVPFIGVVKPASAAALKKTQNNKIGIIGTAATIKSKSYEKEIKSASPNTETFSLACPLFVPIVEEGIMTSNPELCYDVVKHYINEIKETGIDTLILGCTHFPILTEFFKKAIPDVNLIDIGMETALYAKEILAKSGLLQNQNNQTPEYKYFVSDEISGFAKQANIFLGENIEDRVCRIFLE